MSTTDDALGDVERSLRARDSDRDDLLAFFGRMRESGNLVRTIWGAPRPDPALQVDRHRPGRRDAAPHRARGLSRRDRRPLQPELKRTRIDVQVRCADRVEIRLLPGALWQIVSNLVLNGVITPSSPARSERSRSASSHIRRDGRRSL